MKLKALLTQVEQAFLLEQEEGTNSWLYRLTKYVIGELKKWQTKLLLYKL